MKSHWSCYDFAVVGTVADVVFDDDVVVDAVVDVAGDHPSDESSFRNPPGNTADAVDKDDADDDGVGERRVVVEAWLCNFGDLSKARKWKEKMDRLLLLRRRLMLQLRRVFVHLRHWRHLAASFQNFGWQKLVFLQRVKKFMREKLTIKQPRA